MHWILIFWISNYPATVVPVPFDTKELCESALSALTTARKAYMRGDQDVGGVCLLTAQSVK